MRRKTKAILACVSMDTSESAIREQCGLLPTTLRRLADNRQELRPAFPGVVA